MNRQHDHYNCVESAYTRLSMLQLEDGSPQNEQLDMYCTKKYMYMYIAVVSYDQSPCNGYACSCTNGFTHYSFVA